MVSLDFDIENVPNFIKLSRNNTPVMLAIQDLTKEEVEDYAEKYKQKILENWKTKSKATLKNK